MTIRRALFIDGAWTDAGGSEWTALITFDGTGIEIQPYINSEGIPDVVRFSFAEFAAIVEMVAAAKQDTAP